MYKIAKHSADLTLHDSLREAGSKIFNVCKQVNTCDLDNHRHFKYTREICMAAELFAERRPINPTSDYSKILIGSGGVANL